MRVYAGEAASSSLSSSSKMMVLLRVSSQATVLFSKGSSGLGNTLSIFEGGALGVGLSGGSSFSSLSAVLLNFG